MLNSDPNFKYLTASDESDTSGAQLSVALTLHSLMFFGDLNILTYARSLKDLLMVGFCLLMTIDETTNYSWGFLSPNNEHEHKLSGEIVSLDYKVLYKLS